jgi:hypothetical protein
MIEQSATTPANSGASEVTESERRYAEHTKGTEPANRTPCFPDPSSNGDAKKVHIARKPLSEAQSTRPYPGSLDAFRRQLGYNVPLRIKANQWAAAAERSQTISSAALEDALDSDKSIGLIISFSHDDYTRNYGGVQLVIGDEQAAFNSQGWRYLHVSPAAPLPMLADPSPPDAFAVRLRVDAEWLGDASFIDVISVIANLRAQGTTIQCVIHHLMGFAPELVLDLIRAAGGLRPILWIHDFFTVCPSYALMRNDVAFCGGPPPESVACSICSYGDERKTHIVRIRNFFEATQPAVLAPSEIALSLWRNRGQLPHLEGEVFSIARLLTAPSDRSRTTDSSTREQPIRIAHLGARAFLKGWSVFEDLAARLANDGRYEFLQLGSPNSEAALPGFIRNIPVVVNAQRRNAMVEAIAEANIDVVVSWQVWPETFSLSVHEALAGGAFVIARIGAGNVWPAIEANAPDQGLAIMDEAELFDLFGGDDLRKVLKSSPKRRGALLPLAATARWMRARPRNHATASNATGPRAIATSGLEGLSSIDN